MKCREYACQAEIVFLTTKWGNLMPVDAESLTDEDCELLDGREQVEFRPGEHVSHFSTCIAPDKFRGGRK